MLSKIILSLFFFVVLCGMKLMLKDGNFVEVSSYTIRNDKVVFKKRGKNFQLPLEIVDVRSSERLKELEERSFSLFNIQSSIFKNREQKGSFLLQTPVPKGSALKNEYRIKLETKKESDVFFMELPRSNEQEGDVIEKIKKKGVILKIEVPLKQ